MRVSQEVLRQRDNTFLMAQGHDLLLRLVGLKSSSYQEESVIAGCLLRIQKPDQCNTLDKDITINIVKALIKVSYHDLDLKNKAFLKKKKKLYHMK